MENKLTSKEKIEIAVQSGLQLIPYVGGSVATAYFATKQEKRFKRIELFYQELALEMEKLEQTLISFTEHDEESLISLIDRLNDQIEKESSKEKRRLFKTFFIHMLQTPTVESNYDERRTLLDSLASLTLLEFQVLLSFSDYKEQVQKFIDEIESDLYAVATSRLETLGLLQASFTSTTMLGQSPVHKHIFISDFGIRFIEFCME